jgi:hypothetical protein
VDPTAKDTVVDPAAGTGGFLLVAHEHAARDAETLTADERSHLRDALVHGVELVDGTARLAAMNLLLHGIGRPDGPSLIEVTGLAARRSRRALVRRAVQSTVRPQVVDHDGRRRWPRGPRGP